MSGLLADSIIVLLAITIPTDMVYAVVKETVVPEICNGRIEATHGGGVINFFWTGCNSPDCETILIAEFDGSIFGDVITGLDARRYHPYVTPDNTWQVECFYDKMLDPNNGSTPCKYQGSIFKQKIDGIKFFATLTVIMKTCINETCSGIKKYIFVNPARNPCYFNNPCKNNATCNPGVDTYNCTCTPEWVGPNCTVSMPQGFNYTAGKCLDYDANIQEIFVSSAKECGNLCAAMNDSKTPCKSFEIKKILSSNQKKCTLRDSNSLTHPLVTCDGDYFEASTSYSVNSRPKPTSASSSAELSYFLMLICVAWFTFK